MEVFREELDRSGFLYSEVSGCDEFAEKLRQHLKGIVENWSTFGRRLGRAMRYVRPIGITTVTLGLLAITGLYAYFDYGGLLAIRAECKAGNGTKLFDVWDDASPFMVVHYQQGINEIRAFLKSKYSSALLPDAIELYRRAQRYGYFSGEVTPTPTRTPTLGQGLSKRAADAADAVESAALEVESDSAHALWQDATLADVWADSEPDELRAAKAVSVRADFVARAAGKEWISDWTTEQLAPQEGDAIKAYAAQIQRTPTGIAGVANPKYRFALATALGDCSVYEALANQLLILDEFPRPEIESFVRECPYDIVTHWLQGTVTPSMKGYVFSSIVEGAKHRPDPQLALYLLDLVHDGAAPLESLDTDTESFLGFSPESPGLREALSARALQWANENWRCDKYIIEPIVPYVDVASMSPKDQDVLLQYLRTGVQEEAWEYLDYRAVEVAGKTHTPMALEYLREQFKPYCEGTTWGGGLLQAALIDAASNSHAVEFQKSVRTMVGRLLKGKDDSGNDLVYRAYLRFLSGPNALDWSRDRVLLDQLCVCRALRQAAWVPTTGLGTLPSNFVWQHDLDDELVKFLPSLSDQQLIDLFAYPDSWEPLAQFDNRWTKWSYLASMLDASNRDWPVSLAQLAWKNMPGAAKESGAVQYIAARRGGEALWPELRRLLTVSAPSYWRVFGLSRDTESLEWIAQNVDLLDEKNRDGWIEAVGLLPIAQRGDALRKSSGGVVRNAHAWLYLMPMLADCKLRVQGAVDAAGDALSNSDDYSALNISLTYLQVVDTELLYKQLGTPSIANHIREVLKRCDAFGWTVTTQDLVPASGRDLPSFYLDLLRDRVAVSVLSPDQIDSKDSGGLVWQDAVLHAALLETLTGAAPAQMLDVLLELSDKNTFEGLETVPDGNVASRAYCYQLAAQAVELSKASGPVLKHFDQLMRDANNSNSVLARSAAALLVVSL